MFFCDVSRKKVFGPFFFITLCYGNRIFRHSHNQKWPKLEIIRIKMNQIAGCHTVQILPLPSDRGSKLCGYVRKPTDIIMRRNFNQY